jgi:uncharacterized protein YdaU (DUF1376 family)
MSFAYMRLFTGDYIKDTRHLSCAEHGCYLQLLMHCWDQRGPVPLDERKLMGICNARSTDEIEALRRVVQEFFVRMDDGWYNKRMQEEITAARHYSEFTRRGGLRSAEVRRELREVRAVQLHLNSSSTGVELQSGASASTSASTPKSARRAATETYAGVNSVPKPTSCSEPLSGESFLLNDGSEYEVTENFRKELETLYPAVDTTQTLREIRGWCLSNPTKRKTRRGALKFVNGWFAREQNRG